MYRAGYCKYAVFEAHPEPECWQSLIGLPLSDISDWSVIVHRYQRSTLAFICGSYMSIVQTVLQFFSCTEYGDDAYMSSYPSISCLNDSEYLRLTPLFGAMLVLVIALPFALGGVLYYLESSGRLKSSPALRLVFGTLTEGYQHRFYFWECYVLLRRFIISAIAIVAFTTDIPSRFTFLTLVNVMVLGIHFILRPYSLVMDNFAESGSVVALSILTLFLIAAPNPLPVALTAGVSAMCAVIAIGLVVRIASSRYEAVVKRGRMAGGRKSGPRDSGSTTSSGVLAAAAGGGNEINPRLSSSAAGTGTGTAPPDSVELTVPDGDGPPPPPPEDDDDAGDDAD